MLRCGGVRDGQQQDAIERERAPARPTAGLEMAEMDRIERAAENADRCMRARHRLALGALPRAEQPPQPRRDRERSRFARSVLQISPCGFLQRRPVPRR